MDIFIYGVIGVKALAADLVPKIQSANDHINVHINSPGGDVHEGIAIYNALERKAPNVSTYIDGLAYSAASWIALVPDKDQRFMSPNSEFGIHQAYSPRGGNKKELESNIDRLKRIDETQIALYEAKTGLNRKQIEAIMERDKPLSYDEALELGFIAGQSEKLAALFKIDNMSLLDDLMKFRSHAKGEEKVPEVEAKAEETVKAAHTEAETPAQALAANLTPKQDFEEFKASVEPFMNAIIDYIKDQPKQEEINATIKKEVNAAMVQMLGQIRTEAQIPQAENTPFAEPKSQQEAPLELGDADLNLLFTKPEKI